MKENAATERRAPTSSARQPAGRQAKGEAEKDDDPVNRRPAERAFNMTALRTAIAAQKRRFANFDTRLLGIANGGPERI